MVWMLSGCSVMLAVLVHIIAPSLGTLPLSFTRDSQVGGLGYGMFG